MDAVKASVEMDASTHPGNESDLRLDRKTSGRKMVTSKSIPINVMGWRRIAVTDSPLRP